MKTNRTFGKRNENQFINNNTQPFSYIQPPPSTNTNVDNNRNYQTVENVTYNDEHTDNYNQNFDHMQETQDQNSYDTNNAIIYSNVQQNGQIDGEVFYDDDSDEYTDDQVLEKRVQINDELEYENEEDNPKNIPIQERIKQDYYFQTKIRNSGFWGKVKLRNGTWMAIIGFVMFVISTVLIGVFWGFWYSNRVNFPMRIVAITLLSSGFILLSFYLLYKI